MLQKSEAAATLDQLGSDGIPFDFYCDFLGENWSILKKDRPDGDPTFHLQLDKGSKLLDRQTNARFNKYPVSLETFTSSFQQVVDQINIGNSFLTNLTFETPIESDLDLGELFDVSSAKYKLLVPNEFLVFSPETFIKIYDNRIYSNPMKGTIDATLPGAAESILNDEKEKAEHITIVDLIRNDLSQIAKNVQVDNFRYLDTIHTRDKDLLQVSSEISGDLPSNWRQNLGTLLGRLLPAGSISGAPKPETIKIIQEVENYHRGFYTGICGRFDGWSLDTGVMIRFIKKVDDKLFYCSGGGITSFSKAEKEYQEMIDKVYLPLA